MALSKNKPSATSILQRYRRMPPAAQRHIYSAFQSGLNRVEEFGTDYYAKGSGDAAMLFNKLLEAFAPNVVQLRVVVIKKHYHDRQKSTTADPKLLSVRWWPTKARDQLGSFVEYKDENGKWREATISGVTKSHVTLTEFVTEWR